MAAESTNNEAHAQEMEAHVRDYSGFIKLFKYGAIVSFITGLLVMFVIS